MLKTKISKKNKYYIGRHRYLELLHFCMQYNEWKKLYLQKEDAIRNSNFARWENCENISDPTGEIATQLADLQRKICMVDECCELAEPSLALYLKKSVTEGYSYTYLREVMGIPCCRVLFYDRYRKFFWILDKQRV